MSVLVNITNKSAHRITELKAMKSLRIKANKTKVPNLILVIASIVVLNKLAKPAKDIFCLFSMTSGILRN